VNNSTPELRSHIRLLSIPFAPVIVSRGAGTLISQTYISSNPAHGLLLIDPPPSNAALSASAPGETNAALPTPLSEFDYEPLFPIAILASTSSLSSLRSSHRLLAKPTGLKEEEPTPKGGMLGGMFGRRKRRWEVATIEVAEGQEGSQEAFVKIESWLDEIGV
jgi:hypothetical protein